MDQADFLQCDKMSLWSVSFVCFAVVVGVVSFPESSFVRVFFWALFFGK